MVVVQEVIHSMRSRRWGNDMMMLKLDLEKAYDRLSYDFILDTLKKLGLPDSLTHLILRCILSSYIRLSWNGEVVETFSPSMDIR